MLVGISAAGKDELIHKAASLRSLRKPISATTRPPRPGEQDGDDYFFLSVEEFEEAVAAGEMFEWAPFSGDLYGTLLSELQGDGLRVCIRENQGAKEMQARLGATIVAIWPPSWQASEQRMRDRGDSDDQIAARLSADHARAAEIAEIATVTIINDDLNRATAELLTLLDTISA